MNERLSAIVGARISEFRRKMAEVNNTMRRTASNVVVNVNARVDKAQDRLDRIAKTIGSIQTVAGSMAQGSMITVSPAAIPIIASLAGGLGAVSSAFVAAGGAAVAFGAVAIPAISKLFDEEAKLTAQQKKARGEFDKFKSTWQGIVKDLEKPVLQAFSKAMQAANKVLQMARPLFDGAAKAVNNLLESLNTSLDSSPVKAFFDYMNKQGGPMLEKMGKSMGNFMQGFMSLMVAFGPLAEDFANGLLKMSQRFAEWAAGLSGSEKFKSFISYVQTNGPKMLSLIGQIGTFLVNLGVAMAPIGAKILELVTNFFSWTNSMMQAHPWLGKLIGGAIMVGGALQALVPIITLVVTSFGGFGTTLAGIAGKVGPKLLPFISKIGSLIVSLGKKFLVNAARMAASWVIAMGPVGWVIAIVVALVALIIANWDKVKSWTIKTWDKVWSWIKDIWQKIVTAVAKKALEVYTTVKGKFDEVVSFLKGLGSTFYDAGKGLIEQMIKGIKSMVKKVTGTISKIAGKVRDFLPFSPAKTGPLSDLDKLDFAGPIKDSISKGKRTVQTAMASMLQPKRTELTFGAGLNNSDFSQIRHNMDADVSKLETMSRRGKEERTSQSNTINIEAAPIYLDERILGEVVFRVTEELQAQKEARITRFGGEPLV
jgi:cell fate (sporulation/competence/biofilm development) regulator YmcA (YheA/YmcA/DUF963 family)